MSASGDSGVVHRLVGRLTFPGPTSVPAAHSGVVGSGAWTMVAVASNGVARLLTVVLVGRAGGVDVLGTFQTGLSIAQLLVLLLPTALGSAASKFVAQGVADRTSGDPGEVYRFLVSRLRIAAFALGVAALGVWWAVEGPNVWSAIEVVVLTAVLSWYSVTRGLLFGLGLARRSAFWDIATSSLVVALMGTLALVADPQHGGLLVVALTYAVFAAVNTPRPRAGVLSPERRSEIDRFCVAVVFGTLASTGFLQLTMLMSRVTGGKQAAGEFAAALNLATPASLVAASLSLVVFPELAGALARGDRDRVRLVVDRSFRLLVSMVLPGVVVTYYLAGPVVRLVLGEDFSEASSILVILMAAVLITTSAVTCVTALTSGGQRGVQASALLSVTGLLVGVGSWLVLVPALDVDGVAWGYLVGSLITACGPTLWAWRSQRQKWMVPVASTSVGLLLVAVTWQVSAVPRAVEVALVVGAVVASAALQAASYVRSSVTRATSECAV